MPVRRMPPAASMRLWDAAHFDAKEAVALTRSDWGLTALGLARPVLVRAWRPTLFSTAQPHSTRTGLPRRVRDTFSLPVCLDQK